MTYKMKLSLINYFFHTLWTFTAPFFYNCYFRASLHVWNFQLKDMATLQSIKDDEVAASGGNLDNSIINARAVLPIKSCRNLMKFSTFCCRRYITRDYLQSDSVRSNYFNRCSLLSSLVLYKFSGRYFVK